jgi:hypothetical protein
MEMRTEGLRKGRGVQTNFVGKIGASSPLTDFDPTLKIEGNPGGR